MLHQNTGFPDWLVAADDQPIDFLKKMILSCRSTPTSGRALLYAIGLTKWAKANPQQFLEMINVQICNRINTRDQSMLVAIRKSGWRLKWNSRNEPATVVLEGHSFEN